MSGCGNSGVKEIKWVLRRNRETGKMERMVDGAWVPVDELDKEGQTWSEIEDLFKEVDAGVGHAAGPVDQGGDAAGDLAIPGDSAGAGSGQVVEVAAGAGSDRRGVSTVGDGSSGSVGDLDLVDEIPGLTTGDGRSGTKGTRTVLQRLRQGAKRKTQVRQGADNDDSARGLPVETVSQPVQQRAVQRIEVSENAAKPRGPAVRDTTERRQLEKGSGRSARGTVGGLAKSVSGVVRIQSKPSPAILNGQPKWVKDLFEAHFRSSRTRELRQAPSGPDRVVDGKVVTPNRMKMSREDFAIGWLVLLEAARREPAILHTRTLNGRNSEAETEGLPVLSAPSNTI